MKKKKNILCVVAHPDDEALGVGGTLIKHVLIGDKVYIIVLSKGEDAKIAKKDEDEKNKKKIDSKKKEVKAKSKETEKTKSPTSKPQKAKKVSKK